MPPGAGEETARRRPYVGLEPYSENDHDLFFGRQREVGLVIANLKASRLTLLYGESGVGKSSILRAGVMRELHAEVAANLERHRRAAAAAGADEAELLATPFAKPPLAVALFREPWKDDPIPLVMEAVRRAVEEAAGEPVPAWREGDDVVETLQTWTKTVRTILVVFDQFEEYFLYHPDDEGRGTLAGALPAIVNEPDLRVNFLLSIREDSLAKLDRFKKDIPIFANVLRIHPLDTQSAADAIEEPLKRWRELERGNGDGEYRAEPAFVKAVIDEVAARRGTDSGAVLAEVGANGDPADGAGVSAPMLQLVLTRVWDEERSLGSTVLTLATFRDRLKGAENIARTQLDSTMNALGEHEKYVAAKAFERLVTPSGSKYVMSVGDLAAVIEEPRETVADVMKKLADGRILNPVSAAPGTDDQRYEILHDALGRTVLDWSTRHLAEREAQVSTQRARRITAIASGVAAFCLLLAVAAVIFAVDAKRQRETSRSQDRAAQAMIALASDDPVGALRHAVRANDASRTAAAEEALRRAYDAVRFTHVLDDPGRSVDAAAFGPGGDIVTLGSGRLRLRDAATRTDETEMKQYLGSYFAASADGSRVAVAGPDTIRIFDTKTWRQIAQGPSKRDIEGIALSDDGRFLAIAYWLAVDVVDVANATWVATDLGLDRESLYYGVAFSPSGDVLVAATSEGAELWDWRQAEVTRTLAARERAVTNVAFDTEGRLLTVGGETIRVWTTGGQLEAELRAPSRVRSATFSPNGRLIASASANGTAHVWHVATETRLAELIGHRGAVNSVGFSNEGTQLVTGGADGTARVWPLTGDRVLKYPANEVVSAAVSADGKLVATGASDGSGRVVEIETGGVTQDLQTYYAYEGDAAPVNDIALSARGDMVVLATDIDLDNDSSVTNVVWPTADGDENLFAYSGSVDASAVAFHPDGNWIATNARDGVDVWEARKAAKGDKREIRFLEHGKGLEVGALAFDRSGDRLATGATDGRVRIWSWRTRATQPLVSKERHRGAVNDVAFSTEGNLLASGGSDAKVFLWDATNGELRGELTGHTGAVNGVAFSHDGRLLASAGDDGTVRISSVSERRLLGIARPHSGAVTSVSFTPNGRIVSSGEDGTIRRSACTTCLPLERLLDAAERRLDALHVKVDD